jgi:hypothetical protein
VVVQLFVNEASLLLCQRGQIQQGQNFRRQVLAEKISGNLRFAEKMLKDRVVRVDHGFGLLVRNCVCHRGEYITALRIAVNVTTLDPKPINHCLQVSEFRLPLNQNNYCIILNCVIIRR